MDKVPMTLEGFNRLESELRRLKIEERPEIIRAIATAREHGDLSENAEYHAARERQAFVEGRVDAIEDMIRRSEVIDVTKLSGDIIRFGATVKIADEDTDQEISYQIVGEPEADIKAGLLSIASPLGRALIAKTVGDSVEVVTPKGAKLYEIMSVRFS